ncbi:MAG: hypothetical protein KBF33_09580 [Comamonas sp.]|nr:hypothetical protein [Comamonas sp.]
MEINTYANNGLLEKRTPKLSEAVALAASSTTHHGSDQSHAASPKPQGPDKSFAEIKATLPPPLLQTLTALEDLVQSFGDEVQCKELRLYTAFKTLRNFATVVLQRSRLLVYLHLDAAVYVPQIQPHIPATRDVSAIVHWGTGDIEVPITQLAELQTLEPYLRMAYEA